VRPTTNPALARPTDGAESVCVFLGTWLAAANLPPAVHESHGAWSEGLASALLLPYQTLGYGFLVIGWLSVLLSNLLWFRRRADTGHSRARALTAAAMGSGVAWIGAVCERLPWFMLGSEAGLIWEVAQVLRLSAPPLGIGLVYLYALRCARRWHVVGGVLPGAP